MSNGIRIRFAKKLRDLRLKKKWTQEELAEYADLSYRHVQRLESRTNPPPVKIDTIERFAKAFGITISQLFKF